MAELRTHGLRELKTLNRVGRKSSGGEELRDFYSRAVKKPMDVHIKGHPREGPGFQRNFKNV